jgi:hypothetical protein
VIGLYEIDGTMEIGVTAIKHGNDQSMDQGASISTRVHIGSNASGFGSLSVGRSNSTLAFLVALTRGVVA